MLQDTSEMSALLYCRVSTNLLAEGTSLDTQREACAAHAASLGYTVARAYEEIFSGTELFARPKLSLARADVKTGIFQALIVYSVDRLTRNEAHFSILADECARAGCRLIFVTGEAYAAEAYAARVEHQKLQERVTRGRRAKLLLGIPVFTGWNLYGYRPDPDARAYRIDEGEARIVRRIFAMCANGHGMHKIASTFNRENIPSPKSDKRPGARWSSGTVSMILNSRSYIGEEICCKTKRDKRGRDLPQPEAEQVRLPDGVRPAIISEELFETCRQNIRSRTARMPKSREYPTLLRSHIFCAECGSHMIRNYFKRGKYEYLKYRCGSRWRAFDTGCRGKAVNLEPVHRWAWEQVCAALLECGVGGTLDEIEAADLDPRLAADLLAARRALEQTDVSLRALASHLRASVTDPILRPYIEREMTQAAQEKRQLEDTVNRLEVQIGPARQRADALGRLSIRMSFARGNPEEFSFDDQVLALRALGVKVYANGDDPPGWRCVTPILIKPMT
ncbi:MAG: site-specific recombinase [Pyrinomonadaceae bacterium]|nr:site-specific recombinase [Pyrinomonadaceae bacterium]